METAWQTRQQAEAATAALMLVGVKWQGQCEQAQPAVCVPCHVCGERGLRAACVGGPGPGV